MGRILGFRSKPPHQTGVWKPKEKRTKKTHLECKHFKQNNNFAMFLWSTGQVGNCFLFGTSGVNVFLFRTWFCRWIQAGSDRESSRFGDGKSTDFPVFEFLKSDNFFLWGFLSEVGGLATYALLSINLIHPPNMYLFVGFWGGVEFRTHQTS